MSARTATAAVIGAGDYIGAAIARRFAAAGFTIYAGRRNGDKLAPLVADIEGAGGRIVARSLDARKEEEVVAFLADADRHAPLEPPRLFQTMSLRHSPPCLQNTASSSILR